MTRMSYAFLLAYFAICQKHGIAPFFFLNRIYPMTMRLGLTIENDDFYGCLATITRSGLTLVSTHQGNLSTMGLQLKKLPRTIEIVVGISESRTVQHELSITHDLKNHDILALIHHQADHFFGVHLSELSIDYAITSKTIDEKKLRFIAAKRDYIKEIMTLFNKHRLRLIAIDTERFAIERLQQYAVNHPGFECNEKHTIGLGLCLWNIL